MKRISISNSRHFLCMVDFLIDVLDIFLAKRPVPAHHPVTFPPISKLWERDFVNIGNDMRKATEKVLAGVKNGNA